MSSKNSLKTQRSSIKILSDNIDISVCIYVHANGWFVPSLIWEKPNFQAATASCNKYATPLPNTVPVPLEY